MANYCCDQLKLSFEYQKSHFRRISDKTVLLTAGYNDVELAKAENLIKAIYPDNPEKRKENLDKVSASAHNDLIKNAPMILPINFCPYCGKKIS